MKILTLFLCSILFAFAQAPPILRTPTTTNQQSALTNAVRGIVNGGTYPVMNVGELSVSAYTLNSANANLYMRGDNNFIAFGISDDVIYGRHGSGTAGVANASGVAGSGSLLVNHLNASGNLNVAGDSIVSALTASQLFVTAGADITGATVVSGPLAVQGGQATFDTAIQFTPGAAEGRLLVSDATGLATWQNAPVPPVQGSSYAMDDFSDYALGQTNFSLSGGYGWGTNVGRMDRGTNYTISTTNPYNAKITTKLQIRNGGFTRKMPWGSDWMRVRIALLWRFPTNEVATNNFSGAFYLGVCNNTNGFPTNPPTSGLTNMPVWWGIGDHQNLSVFEYKATASSFHTYLGGASTLMRFGWLRVTNSSPGYTSAVGGSSLTVARDEGSYSWVILNLARSSVTNAAWSSGFGVPNNTQIAFHQPQISMAETVLAGDVTITRTGVPTGFDLASGTDATININPSLYGPIDSINFAWTRPGTNAVELAGYAVMKLQ